jgi:uncharacterized protein (DUF2147 family)
MLETWEVNMRNTMVAALVGVILVGPVLADPVFGTWKTTPDDNGRFGHIEIKQCGDTICGELIASYAGGGSAADPRHVGKNIVWNMKAKGNGKYGGGKIWAPDRDKTYSSKMELVDGGNGLKVKGCVAIICRDGGTWSRVK